MRRSGGIENVLKHIVLYKLNEAGQKNIDKIINNFMSMVGQIDGLLSVECGADILKSERSYDFALVCEFDSKESFDLYKTHPAHLPVKAYMHTVVASSKSCDFLI